MVPAALSLLERNRRENTHLICVHNRLTALEMLPAIIDDLKVQEDELLMYDAELTPLFLLEHR